MAVEDARGPDLTAWLAQGYAQAYRTARLILRNPSDAEEAVQDAFLRAWRFRTSVRDDEGVRPWLYRVLVNACYSKLRRESKHRATVGPERLEAVASTGPSPEVAAGRSDVARTVREALAALPDGLRIPVVLRYYSGLSEKEIARAIGRETGTVKSRLHEARRRLGLDPRLAGLADADGGLP